MARQGGREGEEFALEEGAAVLLLQQVGGPDGCVALKGKKERRIELLGSPGWRLKGTQADRRGSKISRRAQTLGNISESVAEA